MWLMKDKRRFLAVWGILLRTIFSFNPDPGTKWFWNMKKWTCIGYIWIRVPSLTFDNSSYITVKDYKHHQLFPLPWHPLIPSSRISFIVDRLSWVPPVKVDRHDRLARLPSHFWKLTAKPSWPPLPCHHLTHQIYPLWRLTAASGWPSLPCLFPYTSKLTSVKVDRRDRLPLSSLSLLHLSTIIEFFLATIRVVSSYS